MNSCKAKLKTNRILFCIVVGCMWGITMFVIDYLTNISGITKNNNMVTFVIWLLCGGVFAFVVFNRLQKISEKKK